jgi:hypothetical protein
MVFEATAAPRDREEFLAWYDQQTEWSEDHGYDDPVVSSPALRAWFMEMIESFPAMNGPYAGDHEDDSKVTDYSVGKDVIYAAFAWSQAQNAFPTVVRLAEKHEVGFFDVSGEDGAVVFPGEYGALMSGA